MFAVAAWIALPMPFAAYAQQKPTKVSKIGVLSQGGAGTRLLDNLRASLRELNYVEGRNLVIEARFAEGKYERLPQLAVELVNRKVDVIVAAGTPATLAAKNATSTIPIVMRGGDAVASGIVASLARPGGNITGTNNHSRELEAKKLDLLKEALPHIRQVAVLTNPSNPADEHILKTMEATARALKVELQKFEPGGAHEFEAVFAVMARKRVDALVVFGETMFTTNARMIAELATKHRLPSIGSRSLAETGGLMSYAILIAEVNRRTAYFVDRILKGAKPADLPVELPTRFEFVVNLKTAKSLGLSIPPSILARADRVIE